MNLNRIMVGIQMRKQAFKIIQTIFNNKNVLPQFLKNDKVCSTKEYKSKTVYMS